MISPHLLKVTESHSTSNHIYHKSGVAKSLATSLWGGNDTPIFMIESKIKTPKWCHMILARGPVLESNLDDDPEGSELIIVWWSEMAPDTARVLSAIEWEKYAKNYQ